MGSKVIECIYENGVFKPIEKVELREGEKAKLILKKNKRSRLDKYVGLVKLEKPLKLEEILDLEEDTWLY